MAPPHPAAKAPSAQNLELLKTVYDTLRSTDEQLRSSDHEIYHLKRAKMVYFSGQCESSDRLQRHEARVFEGQHVFDPKWSQRATDTGLFESVDNLNRQLEKFNAIKAQVDSIYRDLRHDTNVLSRPYLRHLNILDLPDELLLDIFELVESSLVFSPEFSTRKDIQNTRLVCRRFCDLSSPLLVRAVPVNFHEQSLARLDEISRNPNIAKGVRSVRVVLQFHTSSFTDLERFVAYQADELESHVDMFDQDRRLRSSMITDEPTASRMVVDGRAAVTKLRRLASGELDDVGCFEDGSNIRLHLDELHKEHLILFEKQAWLIKSRRFYEIVGSAIARMPYASRLEMSDWGFGYGGMRGLMFSEDNIWSVLHHLLRQPITPRKANKHGLEVRNYECVVSTIDAIRSAGTLLAEIDISLTALGQAGSLVPAPDIRQEFTFGMRELKEFRFHYGGRFDEQDREDLNEFLSASLGTSSLRKLCLVMRSHNGDATRIDLERIMGSNPRKQLTDISLVQIAVDFSVLVRLLERLPEQIDCLSLSDVGLLSGTWEEVLDALRKKESRFVQLREPQGAECDTMSGEDYQRIFGVNDYGYLNKAELYIKNPSSREANPLRVLEDGLETED